MVRVIADEAADLAIAGAVPVSGADAADGRRDRLRARRRRHAAARRRARPPGAGAAVRHQPRQGRLPGRGRDPRSGPGGTRPGRRRLHGRRAADPRRDGGARRRGRSPSRGRSTRSPSRRATGSGCSSCSSRSTGGRCRGTAATAWCARRRPARPRTRSRPVARSSGRRSRRCCSCRSARTRCSAGRCVTAPTSTIRVTVDPYGPGAVVCCDGRRVFDVAPGCERDRAPGRAAGARGAAAPAAVHRPAGGEVRAAGRRLAQRRTEI